MNRMNMRYVVLTFALCFGLGGISIQAQSLQEEDGVEQIMEQFIEYNSTHQKIRGWRVQVIVTTDRRQVETAREKFEEEFPDYPVMFSHKKPFYHLQTGAFVSQADARPFLQRLQEQFNEAFIVADEIDLSEALLYLKDL